MKKSTCKLLLWIGILLIFLTFFGGIFNFLTDPTIHNKQSNIIPAILFAILMGLFYMIIIPGSWIGIILIIIAKVKWNSEEESKYLRQAQPQTLRKRKVNVNLKRKMRKLK